MGDHVDALNGVLKILEDMEKEVFTKKPRKKVSMMKAKKSPKALKRKQEREAKQAEDTKIVKAKILKEFTKLAPHLREKMLDSFRINSMIDNITQICEAAPSNVDFCDVVSLVEGHAPYYLDNDQISLKEFEDAHISESFADTVLNASEETK